MDKGRDGGDTISLTQGLPAYSLFSLYNPPGDEQVCLVEVGGKKGTGGRFTNIECLLCFRHCASLWVFVLFCFLAVACGILVPQSGIKLASFCCGSANS